MPSIGPLTDPRVGVAEAAAVLKGMTVARSIVINIIAYSFFILLSLSFSFVEACMCRWSI
jgi:hypothetical protein